MKPGPIALMLAATCSSLAANHVAAQSPASDTLSLERTFTAQALRPARTDPAFELRFADRFRYVGGQRFILREVADVEQHFFADVDPSGAIRGVYWIQFERFLPGRGTEYSYAQDSLTVLGGREFRSHVRTFADPPVADSDRRRAYDYLAQHGVTVPTPAKRVRLVHVPEANRRQEVMIIYLEAAANANESTPAEAAALIRRAIAGFSIAP